MTPPTLAKNNFNNQYNNSYYTNNSTTPKAQLFSEDRKYNI